MADDDIIRAREFFTAMAEIKDSHAEQREKVAGLEMSVLHQMQGVRSDVSEIKAMLLRPPAPPPDHAALAMQRAMDLIEKRVSGPGGASNATPLLILFAILGAIAIGFLAARFVLGG